MDALNRLTIRLQGDPITHVDSDNDEVNDSRHLMASLNVQQKLGSAGTLRMDLDYLRYSNDNPTAYLNTSTDVASGQVTSAEMETGKTAPLRIVVAKADFSAKRDDWQFEAGVKGAFSRFTNRTSLEGLVEEGWMAQSGFGSRSGLREDVLAAYGLTSFTASEPPHELQVHVLRQPGEQRPPRAREPGGYHEVVRVDQAELRQPQRELHASQEQSPSRLPLELLNGRLQVPGARIAPQPCGGSGAGTRPPPWRTCERAWPRCHP